MKNASECLGLDNDSVAFHAMAQGVAEIQRMIRRTQGILTEDMDNGTNLVVASTYPRDIQLPDNHHNNDKRDITAQDCSARATYV
jgi:stringent starvation protein B